MNDCYRVKGDASGEGAKLQYVQQRMQRFAKEAEMLLGGRLAAMTASCGDGQAPVPPTFTFEMPELLFWFQSGVGSFAVHYGALVASNGLNHVKLPTEHVIPFRSARRPALCITNGQLRQILTGTVADWAELDQRPGAIKVLAHGGVLHRRKFEAVVKSAGMEIAATIARHSSYGQLSRAALADEDCIVVGLRPEHAEGAAISPILLDGALPWKAHRVTERWGLPVHIVWRDDVSAVDVAALESYLETIRRKLAADVASMSDVERVTASEETQHTPMLA